MRISDWSSDVCSSDLSTCSTSDVPMPNASDPNAPCVEVCESPQTIVMPGWVRPCSGLMMCTMPWRMSKMSHIGTPNSFTDRKSVESGKRVSVSVNLGCSRIIKKKQKKKKIQDN